MAKDHTENLRKAKELCADLQYSIRDVDRSQLIFKAPLIDTHAESSGGWTQDDIQGWRKWVENVHHQEAGIDAVRLISLLCTYAIVGTTWSLLD